MSRINLERYISSHYKAGVSPRDVLREALTNAIQAKAKRISVDLQFYDRQQSLIVDEEERPFLEAIEIVDDGEGFTRENIEAFDEVCTPHKITLGGKGVGRLAFLKYAKSVVVSSSTGTEYVSFKYDHNFAANQVVSEPKIDERRTTVRISDPIKQVNTHVKKLIESLCDDLRLLLFFKEKQGQSISITFSHNSAQQFPNYYSYVSSEVSPLKEGFITLREVLFSSYLFRDDGGKGVAAILCADNVGVEDFVISKRFDASRHLVFVSSNYFDDKVNIERQKLELPKYESDVDAISTISREFLLPKIREHCLDLINEASGDDLTAYRAANVVKLKKYYPYIDVSSLGGAAGMLDADEIVRQYRYQKSKEEDDLVENLQAGRSVAFDDLSHLAQEDLARYIVHRALVLESLGKLPEEAIEDEIHKAILPKHDDGEDIRRNNAWLIDDKFLSYSSIHSDEALSRIISEVNQKYDAKQMRKPDIAAFFSRNDQDQPNKLAIVEFKKPGADIFENSKSLAQCRYYASEIVERVESLLEVFAFAITKIDSAFYRELKQTNFRDVFSIGDRILYQDFRIGRDDEVPLHQYVLSATSLVRDAKARNRVFEKVLQLRMEPLVE